MGKARPKRTRGGRPWRGQVRISRQRVSELPETGNLSRFAHILGVHPRTFQRWALTGDFADFTYHPDGYVSDARAHRAWEVSREKFVKWAIETGRYKPRPEY